MTNDQIVKRWRKHLAEKLQDRYGVGEEEARMKADVWLRGIEADQLELRSELQDHGIRASKSRAAAATRR
jgi:hypothetical protein